MAYVWVPGPGGMYFSRWVNNHVVDHTFAERWRAPGQSGNPWWPGSDVNPQLGPEPIPWAVSFLVSAASSKPRPRR